MDSLLGNLFGGESDAEARAKAADFVNRVETGNPTEGFSTEEALTSFSQVAGRLSPDELREATTQALERFSPEQRREFSQTIQSSAGVDAAPSDDPFQIAQLTTQLQSQSPDGLLGALGGGGGLDSILGGLLGGGGGQSSGGGMLDNLLGGLFGGGQKNSNAGEAPAGGFDLGNPIVQAVLAAIAAMAMKKFMGGRDDATAAPAAPGGGSGITGGGGWQPKQAGHQAQETRPAQGDQPGGGWRPKTASHTEGDAKPEPGSGLKGAEAKDA